LICATLSFVSFPFNALLCATWQENIPHCQGITICLFIQPAHLISRKSVSPTQTAPFNEVTLSRRFSPSLHVLFKSQNISLLSTAIPFDFN
jgi:hypothetical protein